MTLLLAPLLTTPQASMSKIAAKYLINVDISDDMAMDVSWDEYMSAAPASSSGPMPEDESIYQGASTETLHEYLMWQLQLTPFSPTLTKLLP